MEEFEFLKEIESIVNLYEKQKAETSDDYNLFSLLSRESDEVLTHSAIIADLLDPHGKHGLGKEPLNLFVEMFNVPSFELEEVQCYKEMPIGKINEDTTKGGRIDIYVKNKNNQAILIENKIYAAEQKNQLLRYHNFAPESTIIYLTLDGESSKTEDLPFDYICISYKEDIINWIEQCILLANGRPKLRESLSQYIHLLKKLTNQTTNHIMAEKISKIIEQNFVASSSIYKNYESAYNTLYHNFLVEVKDDFSGVFVEYQVEILEFKSDQSLNLTHKSGNHSINIRIKEKSIISINVLGLKSTTKEQKENLISNGFKGIESINGNPWKITSDFTIELLANEDSRKKLIYLFNKLITDTINSMKPTLLTSTDFTPTETQENLSI